MRLLSPATGLVLLLIVPLAGVAAQSTGPSVTLLAGAIPPACRDSLVPPPAAREPDSYQPLRRRRMAVPPLTRDAPVRDTLRIEFLVNAHGTVDSVVIHGRVQPAYRAELRATLLSHTFWPATYRGCAVPARMTVELSFP